MTDIEVRDATELDAHSRMSQLLPQPNEVHTYVLRDPVWLRESKRFVFARHTIQQAGDLQVSRVAERFGMRITIRDPGLPYHCFTLPSLGRIQVSLPGGKGVSEAKGNLGAVHSGRPGTAALTSDGSMRLNLWIATGRFDAALAAALGESLRSPLAFGPALDWARGCGPALRRLVLRLSGGLARAEGIASNPIALTNITDLFIHTALHGLPHNYTDRLTRRDHAIAPRTLRRAEEFLHAHAAEPLRMEHVAAAAGCSVRSLQLAFRRFRGSTPSAALQAIRLEGVRRELQCGDSTVASIARRWGFTCAGRFAALYCRRFAESPGATRRRLG